MNMMKGTTLAYCSSHWRKSGKVEERTVGNGTDNLDSSSSIKSRRVAWSFTCIPPSLAGWRLPPRQVGFVSRHFYCLRKVLQAPGAVCKKNPSMHNWILPRKRQQLPRYIIGLKFALTFKNFWEGNCPPEVKQYWDWGHSKRWNTNGVQGDLYSAFPAIRLKKNVSGWSPPSP